MGTEQEPSINQYNYLTFSVGGKSNEKSPGRVQCQNVQKKLCLFTFSFQVGQSVNQVSV